MRAETAAKAETPAMPRTRATIERRGAGIERFDGIDFAGSPDRAHTDVVREASGLPNRSPGCHDPGDLHS